MRHVLMIILNLMGMVAIAQAQDVKLPDSVKMAVKAFQDRFFTVLEEECPANICSAVGCDVSSFLTLDKTQNASLPGLDLSEGQDKGVQYKLSAVRCEFTYEPSMADDALQNLRQRIIQKAKAVGVSLQLSSRKLQPKPERLLQAGASGERKPETLNDSFWLELFPFIPWLLITIVGTTMFVLLIWAIRRVGKPAATVNAVQTTGEQTLSSEPGPLQHMIATKLEQLKKSFEDVHLVETTLKPLFDDENFNELCIFLRHFGPEYLQRFREKKELALALEKLSGQYNDDGRHENALELWQFLDRMERRMVAAKVRIENQPLAQEFSFLATLNANEFIGLLREVSKSEAIAVISYAPRTLREQFFAQSNPKAVAQFVELLTTVDKIPDSLVRQTAQKLKKIYETKEHELKVVDLNTTPLLEDALNALPSDERKTVWNNIAKTQLQGATRKDVPKMFLDSGLAQIPEEYLTEAFLTASPRSVAAYLKTLDDGELLLEKIKPALKSSIAKYKGVDDSDHGLASEARDAIASFIKGLDARGVIDLRTINAEVLGN